MDSPAKYEVREDGYCRWRAWIPSECKERYCYVHQLVAIANGADPYAVFSDGDVHVHHRDEIKYDNRPSNLELVTESEHRAHHNRMKGKP